MAIQITPPKPDKRFQTETKERITVWVDKDVMAWLTERAGWSGRLNAILRDAMNKS